MLRKKAVAIAVSLLMPSFASALGLGALKATSNLNEPFDGRIEILGASATDYDTLSVKLADAEQFERAGVLREAALLSLKFEIVETPAGNDFIKISTREPVREPFLNFLLELNWANGRMVREYTVLLDPPLYDPNRRAPAPAPMPRPAAPAAAAAPSPAQAQAPQPAAVPAYEAAGSVTAESADTAWGLALRHRPDAGVSVQRMMIALLRANPQAFVNGNVNMLRRGAVLKLPSQAELDGLSQSEAVAEVARQHQLWEEYRLGATSAVPAQPMGAAPEAPAETGEPAEDLSIDEALAADEPADDARLELVAPESGAAGAAGEPGVAADEGTSAALAEEDLTAKSQENQELQAKLEEASEIIDLLQRQVEIKDGELASLQARLAELGVETAPAPQAAPAAPETAAAEPPAEAAAEPAPQAATPSEPEAETAPEPEAAPAPPVETAAAPEPAPAKPVQPAAEPAPPAPGLLDSLLPAHLRDAVPGGAVTVLGVLGSLLALGLAVLGRKLARGRGKAIGTAARPAAAVAAATVVAEPETAPSVAELIAPEPEETADRFARTLEASAEQLAPDPLEEVNVYLAYERFDQAEELVKKVIQQYPNEHKYKLRLLEIYYSANNKSAYEEHAKALLDAVGERDPLWENALAMWNEMSPNRALFAPGAPEPASAVAPASAAFVDITGDTPALGTDTMSMAPGADSALAATAVGLTNEPAADESAVDFDLTATAGDLEFEPMLDLTGGEAPDEHDVIDLTETLDRPGAAGFVDLTAPEHAPAEDYSEIFDISGDEDTLNVGDTLKLDSETFAAAAGAASPTVPPADLLDISDTADMDFALGEPLLSSTVDALADTASGHGLQAPAPAAPGEEVHLDFDISDTVAPPVGAEEGPGSAELEADALASEAGPATGDETLDFDIEGLSLEIEPEQPALAATAPAPAEPAVEDIDFSLDLDPEAVADANLALRNPMLDMQIDDRLGTDGGSTLEQESELDFDLALQDTTDFDQLGVDDTLELPGSSGAVTGGAPMSESLEDLTRSMDASLAGLDLDEEPVDDSLLDLDLGSLGTDAIDLDFSVGDIGQEHPGAPSIALQDDEFALERTGLRLDQASAAAPEGESRFPHEGDEADTKLNLAKAYIELGDSEGARTILDEVTREGSAAQQQEARQLLSQLA
jgi:pilus assembly protein FimV